MHSMASERPKILMVADNPDWAYDHIAQFVISELGEKYDFYTDFVVFNLKKQGHGIRAWLGQKRYYLKRFHRRRILPHGKGYDLVCFLGYYFPVIGNFNISAKGIIQGIYTDGFPPQSYPGEPEREITIQEFVDKYLDMATVVLAGSKAIYDRYKPHVKNLYYATGAIDTNLFAPLEHVKSDEASLVVGWTGNPRRPFKGFYDFVVPAVEQAASLRPGISLKTRFSGPLRTLPRFYSDVDLLVIASIADAGPSSFLEAGACGVPTISTRIGFPAEVIHHGENGLFVDRSVDSIVNAILHLYDNRGLLERMGRNIRRDIEEQWGYEARSKLWDRVFEESVHRVSGNVILEL